MIQKLERKFGKYAVPGLMKYVIILYAAGFVISLISPELYYEWLMLDIDKLLKGQVWRLVTFLVQPMEDRIIFMALMLYIYYSIGNMLERVWGTFGFNLYYFMGVLFNILAVVLIYIITKLTLGVGISYPVSLTNINTSMFLALAVTFPDMQFLFMMLIPIKAKYLVFGYGLIMLYQIIAAFLQNPLIGIITTVSIVVAMANFFIYFLMTRKLRSPRDFKRKVDFVRSYKQGQRMGMQQNGINPTTGQRTVTRHKCAVCGRTELDGPELEFRFCSKCNGNYEYCQDHLFTHTHVQ